MGLSVCRSVIMNSFLVCSILLTCGVPGSRAGSRTYGSSCGSCGGGTSASYNNGKNLGSAVAGVIGNKLQHIAGFFDGLSGGGNSGCGGCSSSCGSPGCGSSYVPAPNPCSGGCYSNCGSHGCGASGGSSGSQTIIVIKPSQTSSSGCGSHVVTMLHLILTVSVTIYSTLLDRETAMLVPVATPLTCGAM